LLITNIILTKDRITCKIRIVLLTNWQIHLKYLLNRYISLNPYLLNNNQNISFAIKLTYFNENNFNN